MDVESRVVIMPDSTEREAACAQTCESAIEGTPVAGDTSVGKVLVLHTKGLNLCCHTVLQAEQLSSSQDQLCLFCE